jgi:hypothetical protein
LGYFWFVLMWEQKWLLCRLHLETSGNSNASTYIKGRHRVCMNTKVDNIFTDGDYRTGINFYRFCLELLLFFSRKRQQMSGWQTSYALQLDFVHHFQCDGKSKIRKSQFIRHSYVVRGTLSKIIRSEEKDLFRPRNLVLKSRSNKWHHREKTIIFLDGERILWYTRKYRATSPLQLYKADQLRFLEYIYIYIYIYIYWIYRSLFCCTISWILR